MNYGDLLQTKAQIMDVARNHIGGGLDVAGNTPVNTGLLQISQAQERTIAQHRMEFEKAMAEIYQRLQKIEQVLGL